MASMNVILKEDVASLGMAGEVVKVAGGYARNYLVPQGKAMIADSRNIKFFEHAKLMAEHSVMKMRKEAEALADKLKELDLTIPQKAGEEDKLFGAVTSMDVANALAAEGFEIDKRNVHLEKPLKKLGDYVVPVKLHRDVTADLKLKVVKED